MNNHMEAAVQAAATVLWEQDPTTYDVPAPTIREEWEADTEGYIADATDVIEAALPHIRAMIADEIQAERNRPHLIRLANKERRNSSYYIGKIDGLEQAAHIAKDGTTSLPS